MVLASFYILARSTRNRIAVRLRRLREPRYLFGAVIGAAYLYFALFRPRLARRRSDRGGPVPREAAALLGRFGASLGGAAVLLMAGVAWIFPGTSSLLTFTEAETDFLFPAPVSRRQLLIHRMIRSQFGLLFAAMVPAFLFATPGTTSIVSMALRAVALWIMFVTVRVYFAGVTMARARLGSPDARARRVAWMPLVLTVAALVVVGVGVPFARAMQALQTLPFTDAVTPVGTAATTGLPRIVLWPFKTLLGPLFADGTAAYLAAIPGALLVLLVTSAWVLKSDEVFQLAGEGAVIQKPATDTRRRRVAAPRVRATAWPLALSGRTEMAFMWKNGMQTIRGLNISSLWGPLLGLGFGLTGFTIAMSQMRGLASAICLVALMLAGATTVAGPMTVMSDLRGDLRHLELLKTWPVKGGALIRGEMLWPAGLLTVIAWLALACGAVLSVEAFPRLTLSMRVSLWAAASLVVPSLVFAQYTIHHAAAVMFPAWIPSDNEMRGFDSMGQRLILFGGVLLGLIAMVLPGAIAAGIIGFVFYRLTGSPFVFVPAAAVCLAIVATEVMVATEALGPVYDRLDLSGVERSE
ncbi:MAG TPA: putative ABC exporter domain-containing protein [Vicinamibacterales bacterium]